MPLKRRKRRLRYVDDPTWASLTEAAQLLGIDENTVRRMVNRWIAGERGRNALEGEWITPPGDGQHSHRRVARAGIARVIRDRQLPAGGNSE